VVARRGVDSSLIAALLFAVCYWKRAMRSRDDRGAHALAPLARPVSNFVQQHVRLNAIRVAIIVVYPTLAINARCIALSVGEWYAKGEEGIANWQ